MCAGNEQMRQHMSDTKLNTQQSVGDRLLELNRSQSSISSWSMLFAFLCQVVPVLYLMDQFHSSVSFYGDGYIHLRTVEASNQTLLHVRFRTSSQVGLLFLAAGRRDFLLLELISGRLQVRLDLGSGEHSLRSEKGIHLSDLAWHSMELTHDYHNVTMTVDRNSHTRLRMPGPDLELSVEDGLFVGRAAGLNNPHLLNISTWV
ncbi:Chondroitin sulfate proteoglycan 4 [Larimichthys crocea]|uniref:Chondroitin sulfate proteoglycan 4 n=1 Tax=Larimichthys crocea TaxID=215358 RepID=A0A6G0I0H2_LARCR|nr:Chondroitin sulfate proteoglycan 4 [Larimichthys crocea]